MRIDADGSHFSAAWIFTIARIYIHMKRPEAKRTVVSGGGSGSWQHGSGAIGADKTFIYNLEAFIL